ncbi:B12-binding domain-containing radical SAM protein [Desulfosarcina sp.]|nr:B12-binding domain-containing radical SAM protein [Desulfosarcina sp.]
MVKLIGKRGMRAMDETLQRVLLINSNNHQFEKAMPLGLMNVATQLNISFNVSCEILDLPMEDDINSGIESFVQNISLDDALFVGFSTMCNTFPRSLNIARIIKEKFPEIPVVFGGPQATSTAISILNIYFFVDAVIVGEAESVLKNLMDGLVYNEKFDVAGLMWQVNNKKELQNNSQLAHLWEMDSIPLVDYATYPQANNDAGVLVDAGRGCPFSCTYCSTNDFFQRSYRLKSPNKILEELTKITTARSVRRVDFVHDMFTADRRSIEELCDGLIERKMEITWSCSARIDTVDRQLLKKMKMAGCSNIFFGIETGSQRMQSIIKKNLDLNSAILKIQDACNLKLEVTASFIIGFPQETFKDLADTINLIIHFRSLGKSLKSVQTHMLCPMPGTPITKEFSNRMRYDGFICDFTSVNNLEIWEKQQIHQYPSLFSSFYYLQNTNIDRTQYKFIYWLLFYGARFETFFRLCWTLVDKELGTKFIEWSMSEETYFFEQFDHMNKDECIPLLADKLVLFIEELFQSREVVDALNSSIRFDLWKSHYALKGEESTYLTPYDFTHEDSYKIANDGKVFLYNIELSSKQMTRIEIPQTIADAFVF